MGVPDCTCAFCKGMKKALLFAQTYGTDLEQMVLLTGKPFVVTEVPITASPECGEKWESLPQPVYIDTEVAVGALLPPKKLAAKPKKASALNRRQVQDAMAEALLGVLPAVGMEDTPEHRRRVCRGLVHLGMSFMLDGGKDSPETVKKALLEAFKNEMEERHLSTDVPDPE